ncbi:hypothetical protein KR200_007149 [Drosophila serrata]|nr:hypothetical protein KR200_007149 [Drosophila serrata]
MAHHHHHHYQMLLLLLAIMLAAQLPQPVATRSTSSGGLTVIDAARLQVRTTTSSTITSNSNSNSSAASSASSSSGLRKRHRKRNSNWIDYRNFDENTTALEWANPCGGNYHPSAGERLKRLRPRQSFNQLKRHAFREYRSLNSSQDSAIDIRNMTMWSLHTHNYKFLPKLKPNSTIALKRWYRNMQTYVASFAYLRRQQIRWDQRSITRESSTARELRELLLSSRRILCELETAVNQTQSPRHMQKQRRSGGATTVASSSSSSSGSAAPLPQISRLEMNKRLKLRSKAGGGPSGASGSSSADSIDMRFVKHHYYDFLRTMWQLLRRDGQRRPRKQRNHQRNQHQYHHHQHHQHQHHQNHQHQQQQTGKQQHSRKQNQKKQQHQLEQRWRSSVNSALNRKEFNEVSKPSPSASNSGTGATAAGSSTVGAGTGGGRSATRMRGKRQSSVQRT